VTNINANDELSFVMHQFKEITLRTKGRKCVMLT
jgi:hypothetical protein